MKTLLTRRVRLLALNFFVLGFLSTLVGVIIPNLKADFAVTNEQAGLSFVCWSSGSFCGAYLGGWLFSPKRERALFLLCSALAIVMLLALSVVPNMTAFNSWVFVLSLTGSVLFTTGHASAAESALHCKASTLSLMDFFVSVGNFSTPFLAGALPLVSSDPAIWKLIFPIAALPFVAIFVLALRRRPEVPASAEGVVQPSAPTRYARLLRQPIFAMFFVVSMLLHAAEWAHSVWFVSYASEVVGLSVPEAQRVLGFFLSGMAVSRLVCGALLRRFDAKVMVGLFVVCAAGFSMLIPVAHEMLALAALNFGLGFFFGVAFPILLGLTMELTPAHSSLLSGLGLMGGTIGAQGLAYLIGAVADQASLAQAYRFVPAAMVAFAGSVLAFMRMYPRAHNERRLVAVLAS
jgi:fucose permease